MLENAKFNSFQLGIAWNLVSAAIRHYPTFWKAGHC